MTSMSAIPADWDVHALDELSLKIQDGTHFSPTLGGTEYRYITSRNIGRGRLRLDSVEMISEPEHRKIYRRCDTRLGDLLLTKDGANTGNAAINSFTEEISLLSSVAFIRANPRRAAESYLLQYLLSGPGRRQIEDAMAGNAITRLTLAKIKALQVPTPQVEEQHRIAAALADADDLNASLERMIAKKQATKQGMMQQLLTGKTRLPGFSDSWATTTLGARGAWFKGRGVKRDDLRSAGVRCIRYGELYTAFNDYTTETRSYVPPEVAAKALPLRAGDLLFAGSGETRQEIGKCVAYIGPTPAVAGGDVIVLRDHQCNPIFLALLVNSPSATCQKARAGQGDAVVHIYSHALSALEVTLPSRVEQDAIASVIVDAESEISLLRQRLLKARNLKQGMMQELLTGRTRLPVEEGTG